MRGCVWSPRFRIGGCDDIVLLAAPSCHASLLDAKFHHVSERHTMNCNRHNQYTSRPFRRYYLIVVPVVPVSEHPQIFSFRVRHYPTYFLALRLDPVTSPTATFSSFLCESCVTFLLRSVFMTLAAVSYERFVAVRLQGAIARYSNVCFFFEASPQVYVGYPVLNII